MLGLVAGTIVSILFIATLAIIPARKWWKRHVSVMWRSLTGSPNQTSPDGKVVIEGTPPLSVIVQSMVAQVNQIHHVVMGNGSGKDLGQRLTETTSALNAHCSDPHAHHGTERNT